MKQQPKALKAYWAKKNKNKIDYGDGSEHGLSKNMTKAEFESWKRLDFIAKKYGKGNVK